MVIIRSFEQSPSDGFVFNTQTFRASLEARETKHYNTESDDERRGVNDDLSYIDCRLLIPSSIFAVISLVAIFFGSALGYFYDNDQREDDRIPSWLFASGWYSTYCMNFTSATAPDWYFPSILRLIELTVQANVSFRIATCIPTSLRLFQSYLMSIVNEHFCPHTNEWFWYRWCNAVVPILLTFEIFSCTLFSISTIRQDYQIIYKISFNLFVISSVLHMITCTAAATYRTNRMFEVSDQISVIIKLACLISSGITAPQVIAFHNTFIDSPACHFYVPTYQALCEYILIISNALFHLTIIIDTRNLRFLVYPSMCSGECKPVNPDNFQKGGKSEYSRSRYHISRKQNRKMNRNTTMKLSEAEE